ncbi:MAG TPA: DUF4160 domain-containing protein [Longimicrobiaceae bacterium]
MPTVHREGGFAFKIYVDDHPPPHVHAVYQGGVAKVMLGGSAEECVAEGSRDMRDRDLKRAERTVAVNRLLLLVKWREIHG